jgi:uncharacterized membrane protein SpoIIM required for sporulation
MKVAELIDQRRPAWQRLEALCEQMANRKARTSYATVTEFAALYRDTCADLALAESNQLPTDTIDYLHSLVARAHNQLYRSRVVDLQSMFETILFETPQQIFREPCVHLAALIFWGLFAISAFLSYNDAYWPTFALDVVGADQLESFESMYSGMGERSWGENSAMTGFYIFNNAGIGLRVFATMLLILPGLAELGTNAVNIGAVFGHMFRPDQGVAGENFRVFVTAHGPCELTAIVLSAGAGLRIGLSWLITHGRSRIDSLMINAQKCLPIALCAVALFVMAAFIEGFISPAPSTSIPYFLKCLVAIATSAMLMVYFVILGYPWARR